MTKLALCVVEVTEVVTERDATRTVRVFSPAGGTATAPLDRLPSALAARIHEAINGDGAAVVVDDHEYAHPEFSIFHTLVTVAPMLLTFGEMAAVAAVKLPLYEDMTSVERSEVDAQEGAREARKAA